LPVLLIAATFWILTLRMQRREPGGEGSYRRNWSLVGTRKASGWTRQSRIDRTETGECVLRRKHHRVAARATPA